MYIQQGLSAQNIYSITINSNVTVNVFILNVNASDLATDFKFLPEDLTQQALNTLLQTYGDKILWQGQVTNNQTINYIPANNGNFTVLVSNPTDDKAQIDYTISYYRTYTPRVLSMQISFVANNKV